MTQDHAGPPRLARWVLRRVLDGAARSAILGDLDEEFTRFVVPRLGARAARRWYWRQTIASTVACLREPAASDLEPAERISAGRLLMQDRHGLGTDLRAATRFCWRHPLLSLTVVLTLAVGVGVNTAVFSVLNATYFKTAADCQRRPLRVHRPEGRWLLHLSRIRGPCAICPASSR